MQITFDNYDLLFNFIENAKLKPQQKAELFVGKKHIITIYGLSCEKNTLQQK